MIPQAYITEWRRNAPWSSPDMVEQDLIISRALLAIFSDPFLSAHLAFRGGTAIYKLCLVPPARYSEDIDLVQLTAEPIRETISHLQQALDLCLFHPHRVRPVREALHQEQTVLPENRGNSSSFAPRFLRVSCLTIDYIG